MLTSLGWGLNISIIWKLPRYPQCAVTVKNYAVWFFSPIFHSSLVCLSFSLFWAWLKDYFFHVIEGVNWKPLFLLKLPGPISCENQTGWLLTATTLLVSLNQQINKGTNKFKQITIEVSLQAQSGFKLLKYFILLMIMFLTKRCWVMITINHGQVCHFKLEVYCDVSHLHLSLYHLKLARFKLLRTDFITDYHYVECLDMNNVKDTVRCHKN